MTSRGVLPDTVTARAIPPMLDRPDRACNGADLAVFFPDRPEHADKARAICCLCPIQRQCLDWAVDTRQSWGVWGGSTPEDRAAIIRARREQP